MTDRVIVDSKEYEISQVIIEDAVPYRIVSKIRALRGYRYGLKRLEAIR